MSALKHFTIKNSTFATLKGVVAQAIYIKLEIPVPAAAAFDNLVVFRGHVIRFHSRFEQVR